MPYVQRRNGVVTACFSCAQEGIAEELLADDHPEVVAYRNPPPPTPEEIEAEVVAMLNGGIGPNIDWRKLLKAKFISDLAFRLGKPPGALTAQELSAERNRIAAIYKNL